MHKPTRRDWEFLKEGGSIRTTLWRAVYMFDHLTDGALFRGRLKGGRRWPK